MLYTWKGEVQCSMCLLICGHGVVVSTFPDSFNVKQFSSLFKATIATTYTEVILQGTYDQLKTVIL